MRRNCIAYISDLYNQMACEQREKFTHVDLGAHTVLLNVNRLLIYEWKWLKSTKVVVHLLEWCLYQVSWQPVIWIKNVTYGHGETTCLSFLIKYNCRLQRENYNMTTLWNFLVWGHQWIIAALQIKSGYWHFVKKTTMVQPALWRHCTCYGFLLPMMPLVWSQIFQFCFLTHSIII